MKINSQLAPPLISFLSVNVILEFFVRMQWIPDYIFPAPSQIYATLWTARESLLSAFLSTSYCATLGLLGAVTIGILVSATFTLVRPLRYGFYPYVVFLQTVPIVAIAPMLVIWFGYGHPTVIASSFIVSVFPVIVGCTQGLNSADVLLVDFFKVHKATKMQTFFKLQLPSSLPLTLAGSQIGSGLAVIGAIVGEFIAGSGLGATIDSARTQQRLDLVFGAILLSSLIGVFFVGLMKLVLPRWLKKWGWI